MEVSVRLLAELLLVALAALGVVICLARLPRAPRERLAAGSPPPPQRPDQLTALERVVVNATGNALHVHATLRPVLSEIAAQRLPAHGYRLESIPPAEGRQLLGDRLWEIVRPGRPFPDDRHGPGVTPSELATMVDALERL